MEFNDLLNKLFVSESNSLGLFDIFLALSVPFLLSLLIAQFYRYTAKSNTYSIDFIYALVLFASLSSIITLLIGSNIARAFGLVGALSLIRFRTAVKSPLDSIYLFWALAVGMACGTGFYMAAAMIVVFCSINMGLIYFFKFGESKKVNCILKFSCQESHEDAVLDFIEKQGKKDFKRLKRLNTFFNSNLDQKSFIYSTELPAESNITALIQKYKKTPHIESLEILNSESALFV